MSLMDGGTLRFMHVLGVVIFLLLLHPASCVLSPSSSAAALAVAAAAVAAATMMAPSSTAAGSSSGRVRAAGGPAFSLLPEEEDERVLVVGAFDRHVVLYLLASTALGTFFLFPLWPLLLPLCYIAIKSAFRSWEFTVSERHLSYRSGSYGCFCVCWNQEERIVPIAMVTDVTYSQGCLQRVFGLHQLTIRTAGSMIGERGAPDINLIGLRNAKEVRDRVLDLIGKWGGGELGKPQQQQHSMATMEEGGRSGAYHHPHYYQQQHKRGAAAEEEEARALLLLRAVEGIQASVKNIEDHMVKKTTAAGGGFSGRKEEGAKDASRQQQQQQQQQPPQASAPPPPPLYHEAVVSALN